MRFFKIEEFDCKETGENRMDPRFLDMIDKLRFRCGFPFVVTSGFRSAEHSIEVKKPIPGTHTRGIAADIRVADGVQRGKIIQNAIEMGFKGIGVAKTYIHVDIREGDLVVWTY
jgi:uncharacterized protein YcbK (DUF882 family)